MARRTGSERTAVTRGNLATDLRARSNGADPAASTLRAGVIGARRRALPTGRAVVGGFLVAVAAVIVFGVALADSGTHSAQYAVAAHPLAPGAVIGPGDLVSAPASLPPQSRGQAFRQASSLIGRSVAVEVQAGELIEPSMLVPTGSGSGLRPVSVSVDPESLSDLAPGDSVDVLAATTVNGTTQVEVVMRGASLIAVGSSNNNLSSDGESGTLVTLGVGSLGEVEAVVQAAHAGSVNLVLAEPSDGVGSGPTATSVPTS